MKKLFPVFIVLFLTILFAGCPNDPINKKLDHNARFPETPQNFIDVNSPYDDYNSILPEVHLGKALIFSSNRGSFQGDFNLVGEKFHAIWFMESGELHVENSYYWQPTNFVTWLLQKVSTQGNEFGPYSIGFDKMSDNLNVRTNILAYSTNNDSSIYHEEFVYSVSEDEGQSGETFGPFTIANLSNSEQQYISFYGPDVNTIDRWSLDPDLFTAMYFDANEETSSDIYRIDIPEELSFMDFLLDTTIREKQKINNLSSEAEDRCPFIDGNFMVFTSDRPGGFGGFDLYWSRFENGSWSTPENFGDKINSASDEFRPVVVQADGFINDVMLFSSNRPGGQGGFDLYYVGIDKINPVIN